MGHENKGNRQKQRNTQDYVNCESRTKCSKLLITVKQLCSCKQLIFTERENKQGKKGKEAGSFVCARVCDISNDVLMFVVYLNCRT